MSSQSRFVLFLLRVSIGVYFFFAGFTKIINPEWSAAGYLLNAKTFSSFYAWLASPGLLPFINFINQWGLLLIGLAITAGLFTRAASIGGAALMILYYFPVLDFPYAGEHGYIFDDHIVFALVFVLFYTTRAGSVWGLDRHRLKS